MPTITIEVSEEAHKQLIELGERLPELLELSLKQPPISAQIYQYILNFLASNPTVEQIAAFRPTQEMQERLRTLLERNKMGKLTPIEQKELDEYGHIEHLVILLKAGILPYLANPALK